MIKKGSLILYNERIELVCNTIKSTRPNTYDNHYSIELYENETRMAKYTVEDSMQDIDRSICSHLSYPFHKDP